MNVQSAIESKLNSALKPTSIEVINESHMHSVPENSETHFKVTVVSQDFEGKSRVARHQLIYGLLADELAGPVHALALHLHTETEWKSKHQQSPDSPNCMGGSKGDNL